MLNNGRRFQKYAAMIIDMEIKSSAENINKRAGYLWRFL